MFKSTFLVVTIFALSNCVYAKDDVKNEIIKRCRSQMSEYGAAMVKACADQDIEAVLALNKYQAKHSVTVSRCMDQMREYGFAMVKACVDQDVAAEKALNNY